MNLDVTKVFRRNWEAIHSQVDNTRQHRYVINTGSSRSSKTYSLIDCADLYARSNSNKRITIWRETKTDCKATVMQDYVKRLRMTGRFDSRLFNKTESVYSYENGSRIEFRGTDEESVFGLTQDVAWLNEPYSISKDIFDQIDQRTSDFVLIDWNPKQNHYIDELSSHPRSIVIHSTFKDNPFCPEEQRIKILSYDPTNPVNVTNKTANKYKWDVYGLGIKGEVEGKVFDNYSIIPELPGGAKLYGYGLDFGYTNDPSGLVALYQHKGSIILHELIYSTGLKNKNLALTMRQSGVQPNDLIIADSSNPLIIDELFDEGYGNIHPCVKGAGSIVYGISVMKDKDIKLTASSSNLLNEFENYKNAKDKFGKYINEPEKNQADHLIDACRYIIVDSSTRNNFFVL